MAPCPKCGNSLCTCGHAYRDWPSEHLDRFIAALTTVRDRARRRELAAAETAVIRRKPKPKGA